MFVIKKNKLMKNINLISKKIFFFYFGQKIFSRSYKKFKNIMLFIDYIKFDSQIFNCYIFYFEFFISISLIRI